MKLAVIEGGKIKMDFTEKHIKDITIFNPPDWIAENEMEAIQKWLSNIIFPDATWDVTDSLTLKGHKINLITEWFCLTLLIDDEHDKGRHTIYFDNLPIAQVNNDGSPLGSLR